MLGRPKSYHKRIMGKCIGTEMFPSEKKTTFQSLDGGEEEFEVSKMAGKISSGGYELVNLSSPREALVTDDKLKSREVYCFIPDQVEHCGSPPSWKAAEDSYQGRRVKIVLSKQQLAQLVRSRKELQRSRNAAIQYLRAGERCKKWRPSLATIPEL